jgi:NADPH-dependent curcumin reductase CurA
MVTETRRWHLAARPDGKPTRDDFELQTAKLPAPESGEVLVRTLYLSVDPYMRGRMRDVDSYAEPWDVGDPMRAGVVGEVVESNDAAFEVGDVVNGELTWAEHSIAAGDALRKVNADRAPVSTAVGVLGMPGATAYFGLTDVGDPTPGDTVVVNGAAGAVGSVVGQIARIGGCEVVGIAGSDEKTTWLLEELGFDHAINYTTENVSQALSKAVDGVDIYFDNVGGPITDAVFQQLNVDARVVICGQISQYNATEVPTGPRKLAGLITTRATVQGMLVRDYPDWTEAFDRIGGWIQTGELAYRESVVDGFENAPNAFLGLFTGDNIGKQVVKVDERS